jgi:hypothetical protein
MTNLRLHWITPVRVAGRTGRRGIRGKWAVSTESRDSQTTKTEDLEQTVGHSGSSEDPDELMWSNWGQLTGGGKSGPTTGDEGSQEVGSSDRDEERHKPAPATYTSRRIEVSTSLPPRDRDRQAQSLPKISASKVTAGLPGMPLAAMESLKGPAARSNRGWSNRGREPDTPEVHEPIGIRYPHHAKRWKLGVGQNPGDATTEGVFAIGKEMEEVVFKVGQLICPFRGHQQSTRPRQPHNQAWAHNGIREGTSGCLYINAFNNQDSPVRWLRMAGHEDLTHCRI